jgi:DNA-binding response OmpR family regulator
MIQVNPHRPYIEINGVQHLMGLKRARFAEMLLKANGQPVSFEQIMARLSTTKGTVQVYAHSLRRIFEPHGFALVSEFGMGYRLQKLRAPEFALESRVPLKAVSAVGR